MKNPFRKNDHKALIVGIVIGSLAAGVAAYLFLTDTGKEVRGQLSGHLNKLRDTFLGNEPESNGHADKPAYLQTRAKTPSTDRDALKRHEIFDEDGRGNKEVGKKQRI